MLVCEFGIGSDPKIMKSMFLMGEILTSHIIFERALKAVGSTVEER